MDDASASTKRTGVWGSVLEFAYGPKPRTYFASSYPYPIPEASGQERRLCHFTPGLPHDLDIFLRNQHWRFIQNIAVNKDGHWFLYYTTQDHKLDTITNFDDDPEELMEGKHAWMRYKLDLEKIHRGDISSLSFGHSYDEVFFMRLTKRQKHGWKLAWGSKIPEECQRVLFSRYENVRACTFGWENAWIVYGKHFVVHGGPIPQAIKEILNKNRKRTINKVVLNPRNSEEYVLVFDNGKAYCAFHKDFYPKFLEVFKEWRQAKMDADTTIEYDLAEPDFTHIEGTIESAQSSEAVYLTAKASQSVALSSRGSYPDSSSHTKSSQTPSSDTSQPDPSKKPDHQRKTSDSKKHGVRDLFRSSSIDQYLAENDQTTNPFRIHRSLAELPNSLSTSDQYLTTRPHVEPVSESTVDIRHVPAGSASSISTVEPSPVPSAYGFSELPTPSSASDMDSDHSKAPRDNFIHFQRSNAQPETVAPNRRRHNLAIVSTHAISEDEDALAKAVPSKFQQVEVNELSETSDQTLSIQKDTFDDLTASDHEQETVIKSTGSETSESSSSAKTVTQVLPDKADELSVVIHGPSDASKVPSSDLLDNPHSQQVTSGRERQKQVAPSSQVNHSCSKARLSNQTFISDVLEASTAIEPHHLLACIAYLLLFLSICTLHLYVDERISSLRLMVILSCFHSSLLSPTAIIVHQGRSPSKQFISEIILRIIESIISVAVATILSTKRSLLTITTAFAIFVGSEFSELLPLLIVEAMICYATIMTLIFHKYNKKQEQVLQFRLNVLLFNLLVPEMLFVLLFVQFGILLYKELMILMLNILFMFISRTEDRSKDSISGYIIQRLEPLTAAYIMLTLSNRLPVASNLVATIAIVCVIYSLTLGKENFAYMDSIVGSRKAMDDHCYRLLLTPPRQFFRRIWYPCVGCNKAFYYDVPEVGPEDIDIVETMRIIDPSLDTLPIVVERKGIMRFLLPREYQPAKLLAVDGKVEDSKTWNKDGSDTSSFQPAATQSNDSKESGETTISVADSAEKNLRTRQDSPGDDQDGQPPQTALYSRSRSSSDNMSQAKYFELCVNVGRDQLLAEVDVTGATTNAFFFAALREDYLELRKSRNKLIWISRSTSRWINKVTRGKWMPTWNGFDVFEPDSIRYVKFRLDLAGSSKLEVDEAEPIFPPLQERNTGRWEMEEPEEYFLEPMPSRNFIGHLIAPSCTSEHRVRRLPKKVGTPLLEIFKDTLHPESGEKNRGWGVHVYEKMRMDIVLCLIIIGLFMTVTTVVIVGAIKKDAVDGFTVAALFATLFTIFLAPLFAAWMKDLDVAP